MAPFSRPALIAIFVAIGLMILANNVGAINLARWVDDQPLRLIAFNSTNKILLTVAGRVPEWLFFAIPLLRLLAPDPLFYALGARYRDQAVRWGTDLYPGAKDWLVELTSGANPGAHRTLAVAAFIAPNNPVCLAAGVIRMRPRLFWTLNVAGTLTRIALIRLIAAVFADQLDAVVDFIVDSQAWFTRIALAVLAVYTVVQLRRLAGSAADLE
ncbi:MAG: hypothetical protein R2754_03260 [Microthrixaceae bacterium]